MPRVVYKNKDGKRLQGVTTIKKNIGWGTAPLMWWANKQGLEGKTLQEAYDTVTVPGTIGHYLVECFLKKKEPQFNLEWSDKDIEGGKKSFANFEKWSEQFEFEPLAVEPNLISEEWQFGGTPDVIGLVLGELSILDWKSGKFGYPDSWIQPVAYKVLAEENGYKPIKRFDVLQMPRDGKYLSFIHHYRADLPDEAWGCFERALYLAKAEKVLKQLL